MYISMFVGTTASDVLRELASRAKQRRLDLGWTRDELAERAGVAFSTLRLFEQTGRISLERLVLVAQALKALDGFGALFAPPAARTLADVERTLTHRVRGRRRP